MSGYVIETRKITKKYGSLTALDQVSIHVGRGEIYGLIGDNGAGKTTLLKALAGLIWPDHGDVVILGRHEEKALGQSRRQIGAMVEHAGYFPKLSVEKNMEYFRILKGIPGKNRSEDILRLTGLWDRRKSKCGDLSMGMKQRLGLAIAMIGEPQILILDEPINGLDPSGIIEFRQLLHRLNEEKNITILLSSHILSELEQTATIFGFLNKGKLMEEIPIQTLREKCFDDLIITVTDPQTYAALLDRHCSHEHYTIMPDHTIRLAHPTQGAEVYSKLAADHGILITGMERHQQSLENYYMQLKEDACHA